MFANMTRWSLLWTVICTSYFIILRDDVCAVAASPITLFSSYYINDKKPLGLVNDRFLSYTLEPDVLMHVADCGEVNGSSDYIRTLLPAYLRIAGPYSNKLHFLERENESDKSQATVTSTDSTNLKHENFLLTGPQWLKFIDFVKNTTGLRVIVSLNGNFQDENSDTDLTNALEFINYSSKHHLDLDWELGYELQRTGKYDGGVLGRDTSKLRKVLDVFPRYQNSLILGPGITSLGNRVDLGFVRNYLSEAGDSLDALMLHYDFSNLEEDENIYEKLLPIFSKMDSSLWIKEGVPKALAKGVVDRKSVWLSESGNQDRSCSFSKTLSFVQRLGAAAKLGVSVYLRKPHIESISEPTSEYWAAALFKSLVGKTVLDAKFVDGNNTKVFAFSHCTRVSTTPENFIINPNVAYKPGAITLYGTNTGSEWSRLYFKLNSRYEQIVHMYVLTEEKGSYTSKTLFNKQEIRLSADNELPIVSPKIRESAKKYVVLPPKSIFFLVLPYVNSRTCMSWSTEEPQDGDRMNRSAFAQNGNETSIVGLAEHLEDGESDDGAIYVSYPRKQESSTPSPFPGPSPAKNTKYITYSEDTWLSPLPDQLREIFYKGQARVGDDASSTSTTSHSKKEKRGSKIDNYRIITHALLGKRNVSQNSSQEPSSRSRRSIAVPADGSERKDIENQQKTSGIEEDGANLMHHMLAAGSNDDLDWNTGLSDYFRWRRDDNSDVSNSSTLTLPSSGDFESLSSLARASLPFDDDAIEETVRLIRAISSANAPTNQALHEENLPNRLHRKSRKTKSFKEPAIPSPTNQTLEETMLSSMNTAHTPLDDADQTPVASVQTETSIITSTSGSTVQSDKSDIAGDTTVETTTIGDTLPTNARSAVESINRDREIVERTEEQPQFVDKFEPSVTLKPHAKPRKDPISPIKRKPGYMSTTTTVEPTRRSHLPRSTNYPLVPTAPTRRSHKVKPTDQPVVSTSSTKRSRAVKFTTTQPNFSTRKNAIRPLIHSDAYEPRATKLPKTREVNHAKLKETIEANLARIQKLKDERMRRKSAQADAGSLSRAKRNADSVQTLKTSPLSIRLSRKNKPSNAESRQESGHNLFNDLFGKTEHMSKDLSTNVKDLYSDLKESTSEKVRSLIDWIEKKYKEIRRELVATRSTYDVAQVRKHVRDYNTKIQKELGDIRALLKSRSSEKRSVRHPNLVHPLFKTEPDQADILGDGAYTWAEYPRDNSFVVAETFPDMNREVSPPPELTLQHHSDSSDSLVMNSRPVRSLVSNEIVDDGDESHFPGNEISRKNSASDSFEENMVDAKLRAVGTKFVPKKPIVEREKDHVFQNFIGSHLPPKTRADKLDDDNCDRNANIFAYLWCKCKDFFNVMIRVLEVNNRD